jgi:hypothetical protein
MVHSLTDMDSAKNRPPTADNGEDWVRQFALSEEYLLRHHPKAAGGPYRWFESPNVTDLVRVQRQRARPKSELKEHWKEIPSHCNDKRNCDRRIR